MKVPKIAGAREWKKHREGGKLTRAQAMKAQCYECNGLEESGVDCKSSICPLYPWHPHKGRTKRKNKNPADSVGIATEV